MTAIDPEKLHRESLVIDGLNASYHVSPTVFPRVIAGGVTAVHATVAAWHSLPDTMRLLARYRAIVSGSPDRYTLVLTASDIPKAKMTGRLGIILGFQGTDPIDDDLALLGLYQDLGVRIIQLTYSLTNRVGSGYADPHGGGLTPFGRQVVKEMNRLGLLIDLSHCGDQTAREAIELSERPVAFTHVNSRAFCDSHRNKPPEILKAASDRGGVIGTMAFAPTLSRGAATLDHYLDSIENLVGLCGIDHVGLGPDFMEEMPADVAAGALTGFSEDTLKLFKKAPAVRGLASIAELRNVTRGLVARGFSETDVRKVLGENWLRLYESVWPREVRRVRA